MLSFFIYYVVFGAIAVALGTFLYRRWDKKQSRAIVKSFKAPDWLQVSSEPAAERPEASDQELYDFSMQFVSQLRGALASGTDTQLARVGQLMAEPHTLHETFWREVALRLSSVCQAYKHEYTSLLEAVFEHSQNTTQQNSAFRMASCVMDPPSKLRKLAKTMSEARKFRA